MPDDTCHIENCQNVEEKYGLCHSHYGRWWRYSDPYWADDGYYAAHKRVRLTKGQPTSHRCAGCGVKRADQWAYDHRDPHSEVGANGLEFSVNIDRYVPLCISCHKRFDALVRRMKQSIVT